MPQGILDTRPVPTMGPASPLLATFGDDAPLLSGWSESEKTAFDASELHFRHCKPRRRCCFAMTAVSIILMLVGTGFWASDKYPQLVASYSNSGSSGVSEASAGQLSVESQANGLASLAAAGLSKIAQHDYILDDAVSRTDFEGANSIEELDTLVCGESPCQFVMVGSVREGTSKAQLHLTQVARLAKSLNRVVVLPNVKFGLFSTCHEHPFDLYYDIEGTSKVLNTTVMLMPDFERYTQRRTALGQQLTAQIVRVGHNGHDSERGQVGELFSMQVATLGQVEEACPRETSLDLSPFRPAFLDHDLPNHDRIPEFGQYISQTLDRPHYLETFSTTTNTTRSPDVYHLLWMVQRRLWQDGNPGGRMEDALLPYHARWRAMTDQITANLSPMIALHWRQEAIRPPPYSPDFTACARAAHAKLTPYRKILQSVYFLTDYSLNGTIHSITYDRMLQSDPEYRKLAEDGMDELYAWPGFRDTPQRPAVRILTLDDLALDVPLANGDRIPMKNFDSGLLGLIDKMMADRAMVYLTGQPRLCARLSSFSQMVVEERHLRHGMSDTLVEEVVSYFPDTGIFPYEY